MIVKRRIHRKTMTATRQRLMQIKRGLGIRRKPKTPVCHLSKEELDQRHKNQKARNKEYNREQWLRRHQ